MSKTQLAAAAAAVIGMTLSAGAMAQAKPEILVKQRQAAMTLMGKYIGPMVGMAQGKVPFNADVVKRNAGFIDNLSRMPWDGFDPSTRGAENTKALPVIFDKAAEFKERASHLENEASKLVQVSAGGDEGAIKAQIGALGKACGGCHNDFRQK